MSRTGIDPQLPYIQVHRTAGPKAAQLAIALKVTYQHARGGLDVFWESLADRRLLDRHRQDIDGVPAFVMGQEELERRLRLAFGVPVDVSEMVSLGFLEPVSSAGWSASERGFRVRGMSRYLNAEAGRKAKKGTAPAPAPDAGDTMTPPRSDPGDTPVSPRSFVGSNRGATPQRREARGESEETRPKEEEAPPPPRPVERGPLVYERPSKDPREWLAEDFFAWSQFVRQNTGWVGQPRPRANLSAWWSEVLQTPGMDADRAAGAFLEFAKDPHWRAAKPPAPFEAFVKVWRNFVPAAARGAA